MTTRLSKISIPELFPVTFRSPFISFFPSEDDVYIDTVGSLMALSEYKFRKKPIKNLYEYVRKTFDENIQGSSVALIHAAGHKGRIFHFLALKFPSFDRKMIADQVELLFTQFQKGFENYHDRPDPDFWEGRADLPSHQS